MGKIQKILKNKAKPT
jgi:large subunit ribosomal protein L23Ae